MKCGHGTQITVRKTVFKMKLNVEKFWGLEKLTHTLCPAGGYPWLGLLAKLEMATHRAFSMTVKRLPPAPKKIA
jgi:hypothetical protein